MRLIEQLEVASHGAQFAKRDLQGAMKQANAVESIVIMGLIEAAADLENRTLALLAAVKHAAPDSAQ
jgi:hypothetical protein